MSDASNLSIASPDFDRIKKEAGVFTRDAINLLWAVLNDEIAQRRRGDRASQETVQWKTKYDAPTVAQHNYDTEGASLLFFTGGTAFDLTGFRNGGAPQRAIFLHNLGTGAITVKYESASSDATNRIDTQTGADVTITTGKSMQLMYGNGRWRQQKDA